MANRTHKTNQKLSQAEYRRHIFDRARGVKDGAASARANLLYGDQPFYKPDRSLGELYEQENSVKNWGNLDSTDRKAYRAAELKEVQRLVKEAVKKHPGAKGEDKNTVDSIVNAYLEGKELPADLSDSARKDWQTILEDSTAAAIEGKELPTRWKSSAQTNADSASTGSVGSTGGAPVIVNGKEKAPGVSSPQAGKVTPLPPRIPSGTSADVTTQGKYERAPSSTGVLVNGAPLEESNTAGKGALRKGQNESLTAAALSAERERKKVQNDMRSDARRLEQEHLDAEDALDARLKERRVRKQAERDAAQQARMDKRYEARMLSGMTDWENLGRDSVKRNFGARAEGESNEDWGARSGAVDAVAKLRNRFATLGVKDTDKNEFYAYNPNRMRDVAGLGKLFDKAVENGSLTDAQIEGINKTLDSYESEGRKTKATIQRNNAMRDAENIRKYREMYGMGDRDVFSDDDVKEFHKETQAANRKEILKNMQVAPGQGGEQGRGTRIADFSDNWMKLINHGFDVSGTFKKAMSDPHNRQAFQKSVASIAMDDPERNDKLDQIRRRFVMNQAMEDAGLGDKVLGSRIDATGMTEAQSDEAAAAAQADVMTQGLPGKSGLPSDYERTLAENIRTNETLTPLQPSAPSQPKAPATSLVPGLLAPRKEEETQQAAKGGMALRPRRRAS